MIGTIFMVFVWIFLILLLLGVVKLFRKHVAEPLKETHEKWDAETQKRYEDLPELGKARVDKQAATLSKWGGAAAATGFVALLTSLVPFGAIWITGVFASKWAYKNWKENDEAIKAAEERRAKAMRA